jgi:hypothetical protein
MFPWREGRIVHGRTKLARNKISKARAVEAKATNRNKPRGSSAKEAGRNAIKRGMIFVKANGSSKGPRKAGRC